MADEPVRGWLPPAAPGGEPPPRFDTVPQEQEQEQEQEADAGWEPPAATEPEPAAPPPPRQEGPTFVRPPMTVRNPLAAWALGCGIAGIGLLLLSLGSFFVVTLPLSAAAWVLGARARRRAREVEATTGEAQATAALWLGRIGVVVGLLAMIAFIALVAAGFDFEQLRDDLERELERQRRESDAEGVRTAVEGLRATVSGLVGR